MHKAGALEFESTNQEDSAGRKNCTVLTSMYVYRKAIEVGEHFILEIFS